MTRQGDRYHLALERLAGMARFGVCLGLERMEELMARLSRVGKGAGGEELEAVRFVHVAGTNGKGTTAALIEAGLRASGIKTGLYTSPHLCRFTERIQVEGREIPGNRLADLLDEVLESAMPGLTFFEAATAVALLHFAREGVQIAVLETGLGGRLDATNIVRPMVSVITPIALDHTEVLGETLEEIAGEKAGIIKDGVPVVAWPPPDPEVRQVLTDRAVKLGSRLVWSDSTGSFTAQNRSLARTTIELLVEQGLDLDRPKAMRGLDAARWPGRLEWVNDQTVLDGAHNPAGCAALVKELAATAPLSVVMGIIGPRDPSTLVQAVLPLADQLIFTRPRTPRALDPAELTRCVPDLPCRAVPRLADALDLARRGNNPVLVTGSLYLVGEARALLLGEICDPVASWDPLERIIAPQQT